MTPTGVLLGATMPAGRLWSRVLRSCQAVLAELRDQKSLTKNLRSGSIGLFSLVLAVLAYTLYNNLLSIFQAWTAQGKVPTWVGLWPVHLAVVALLAILLSRQMVSRRWFMLVR